MWNLYIIYDSCVLHRQTNQYHYLRAGIGFTNITASLLLSDGWILVVKNNQKAKLWHLTWPTRPDVKLKTTGAELQLKRSIQISYCLVQIMGYGSKLGLWGSIRTGVKASLESLSVNPARARRTLRLLEINS